MNDEEDVDRHRFEDIETRMGDMEVKQGQHHYGKYDMRAEEQPVGPCSDSGQSGAVEHQQRRERAQA